MGFDVSYGGAALAGLLSFLSPCILPIVPFYLCYLAGMTFESLTDERGLDRATKRRVVLSSIFFALGVATVFVLLGATATALGGLFRDWFHVLRWVAALIVFMLGLHFIGLFRISFLYREARIDAGARRWGYLGAYVIGLAFAFGWTPCVGPVLATILFTAAGQETAAEGATLLLFYAAGMTLPFIVAALFVGPFLNWAKGFRKHLGLVEKIMGAFLILFAILLATNSMNIISQWMLDVAPDIGTLQ